MMKYRIVQKRQKRHGLLIYTSVLIYLETMLVSHLKEDYRGLEQTLQHESSDGNSLISRNTSSVGNGLVLKCQDHPVWKKDPMWRNGILQPEICRSATNSSISIAEQAYMQEQLVLLKATIHGSNADFIPCGVHCVYHLDSAYSYQHGHPIFGWLLRAHRVDINEKNLTMSIGSTIQRHQKMGCWEPFNSQSEDSRCVIYYFNDWTGYVEDVEAKQRKLPMFDKHSDSEKTINAKAIQEKMSKYQPDCPTSGEAIYENGTSSNSIFCHFRSYDGGNYLGIRRSYDFDTSSLEFRRNLRPSEIVRLFDRRQLGIDYLADALASMTETFDHIDTVSCDENGYPKQLLLCVYHRHSIPRSTPVPGQHGSKVPIKGWQYRTLDRCFIPIEDMEHSSQCGRSSIQYSLWLRHMPSRQHQLDLSNETVKSEVTKCDRLPLLRGRNVWDNNTDEYVFLPPLPTTEPHVDGVLYSEESVCGPRILIVGAMKCGTNTIGTLLSRHPRLKINRCSARRKPHCDPVHFVGSHRAIWENHGLSHKYNLDRRNFVANYARKLPETEDYEVIQFPNGTSFVGRGSLTFDKSPSYLNTEIFPNIANRAKQLLPNAKIVISLCNPVERMYSEFHHNMKKSKRLFEMFFKDHKVPVPTNFTEMIEYMKYSAEICFNNRMFCDEIRRNLLRTGIFHESVRHWRNVFGTENVLVLDMDESNHDKVEKLTSLMGNYLPKHEYPWDELGNVSKSFANENYSGRSSGFSDHKNAFQWLRGYFYRHNVALAEEIHAEWPLQWNRKPIQ